MPGMRFLAGAIVVLSGSLLWAAGALALTWTHISPGGNLVAGKTASYGGMAIAAIGVVFLFLAHNANPRDKA
jgi:hypothetical protein